MSVEKWLSYMYHAELVITNSYHTLSFAILFKKLFVLFKLNEGNTQSNARMCDLLNTLGLKEQIYSGVEYTLPSNIDWPSVESCLSFLRVKSEQYIQKIILGENA